MYKRDRPFDSEKGGSKSRTGAPSASPPNEDECPVQMKIAKSDDKTKLFPVVFKWNQANTSARNVAICGSWDKWNQRIPLVKSSGDFSTIVDLEPGKHEYKFYVDHKWVVDDNQQKTSNHLGGENNVVMIDEADYEVS
ncbi:hypothetical protein L5515_019354 [Caenorhabditis briggsae]|nr:hypothetical protein L5515_019354 [Caenorhabditis briggsae]